MSIHALSRSTNTGFTAPVVASAKNIVFTVWRRLSCWIVSSRRVRRPVHAREVVVARIARHLHPRRRAAARVTTPMRAAEFVVPAFGYCTGMVNE